MENEHYYLKVRSVCGANYIFKSPPDEQLLRDADLGYPYDVLYGSRSDAEEILCRTFTLEGAMRARVRFLDELKSRYYGYGSGSVEIVRVKPEAPLTTFDNEGRLLRILQLDDKLREEFSDLSVALASSRADGVRTRNERLFFRRGENEFGERCFTVEADRLAPAPAKVVARYGDWRKNESFPRLRAERFRFLEWDGVNGADGQCMVTSACRQLQWDEAEAIEASLSMSEEFCNVRVVSGSLRTMDATEGLGISQGDQPFAQAAPETEAAMGFPYFLSVFPREW